VRQRAAAVADSYGTTAPVVSEEVVDTETLAQSAPVEAAAPAVSKAHSSAELLEEITGKTADAPLCMTCGIKMRPAGSCYVCEGCGSTSGCS
jgi:ribonucleoside-diphosphate reductase alpha chain